jgi:hypothetical protein
MLAIATLLLIAQVKPPANFTVKRDTITIGPVVWYDGEGQRHVTDEPYLQIRYLVTNDADHSIRWPGFHSARVKYRKRTEKKIVGGAVLPVKFGPGPNVFWENSLRTDQVVNPGQKTQILVVFDLPRTGGDASVNVQWRGETPGWNMTVGSGFKLPDVPAAENRSRAPEPPKAAASSAAR